MGHKHGPLLFRQFGKSQLKLFQHFTSQVRRFWPGVRGRQKIFDAQQFPLLRNDFGDSTILLGHESDTRRLIHPLLKTDDRREYCRETSWSEPLRHSRLGHYPEFRSGENWVMLMLGV